MRGPAASMDIDIWVWTCSSILSCRLYVTTQARPFPSTATLVVQLFIWRA
jgi:hypothetical protein